MSNDPNAPTGDPTVTDPTVTDPGLDPVNPDAEPTTVDDPVIVEGDKYKPVRDDSDLNLDDNGNLIDPPTIASFERDISEAANAADNDRLAQLHEDYAEARLDLARRRADRQGDE